MTINEDETRRARLRAAWHQEMEASYDRMPTWWWDPKEREARCRAYVDQHLSAGGYDGENQE